MRRTVISVKELALALMGIVLYMQNWLIPQGKLWGYADEGLAAACLLFWLLNGRMKEKDRSLLFLMLLTMGAGVLFNLAFGIQPSRAAIPEDILSMYKFILVYLGLSAYVESRKLRTDRILTLWAALLKPYLMLLCLFAVLNLLRDVGMSPEVRYGLRSYAFLYGTPGHLINQMSYSLLILHGEERLPGRRQNVLWIAMTLFIMAATLKTRAFILIFLYGALYYIFIIRKKRRIGVEIALTAAAIGLLGLSQFQYYFMNDGTPRQRFVAGAVRIVKELFPFGTGFGTYGSSAAAHFYSPLYRRLGFSEVNGMSPESQLYLNDNYLPMIFGEFGLLFAIVFLFLIYRYARTVLGKKKARETPRARLMAWFFVGDMVLSSVQSSYLAHYSVVALSFFYFLIFAADTGTG